MSEFLDRMAPFVIETGSTEILADTYEYRIVRNGFEPRLPGFVGLVGKVLFIASITPAEYREYIFWHEVMCVAKNDRKNCADTVRAELERVPESIRGAYIFYRYDFFNALVLFFRDNPPPFFGEIIASRDYLGTLHSQM
jgi:hypothetical protein